MKRNAFSLIELIFVILILGIISSVAIVKMGQMTERTRVTKLKAFVGTLNRSVGGGIWFKSIQVGREGSVAFADYDANIGNYVELVPGYASGPSLVNCNDGGTGVFLSYAYEKNYEVHCTNGNKTTSPNFRLFNVSANSYMD